MDWPWLSEGRSRMSERKVDLHLIHEVQKGNKRAFDALVLKYQYKVFRLVSRYISDPSEVLDVTQDTFIKAYQSLEKFRGESGFYTWLYRIAINTAKNHIISQGRKVPAVDFELTDVEQFMAKNTSKDYSAPERTLMCQEMEQLLYTVIEDLPRELRTAIMLREVENLTYDEIAAIMGCPVGTVRSRIFRARETIEKLVQPMTDH